MVKMTISKTGLELIKSFEGLSLKAYKPVPTEKYWTIGYGHYGPDVKKDMKITKQQAEEMLKRDIVSYVNGVNSSLKVEVNQNQFDALVSFAYNCGVYALSSSALMRYVNQKKFEQASNEFGRWVHSGKTVLKGLVRRRETEKILFLTPIDPVKEEPKIVEEKKPTTTVPKIKVLGRIKINVTNFTYIYEKTSDKSKRLGTAPKNMEIDISGSITGWWEVIYNGKRAYVKAKYGKRIK